MELFFYVLLTLASIVGVTFIIERGMALRWEKVIPKPVLYAVDHLQNEADFEKLRAACRNCPSPLSRLILLADEHRQWPRAENVDSLQTRARHEVTRLERGLVVLEIVVGIAPLLGLVGTVYGLIVLFHGLNVTEVGNSGAVAHGIALALRATMGGLLTAIPSLIAWSYYTKKVENMAVEMETVCDHFLRRLYREKAPGQPGENRSTHVVV